MESAEELASLNLGSDYAMQSTVVPQAEALASGVPTPFNTGLPVQSTPRPEGYYPGYTSRAYQEDNDSFLTKVGMVLMAGGTKPGEVPAPFRMKMMQNELALKRSEEERGWQNFHQTQQVADETIKLHNREAMSMGLKMLPQFKGMIHMQRDPEKRQAMTDHLKTMLESYAPGLGKVLDTMNTSPAQVLGFDYMAKHPVYGKQVQDLADNRSYEDLVVDPTFKHISNIIGRDLMTDTIGHFTIAQHEKLLSKTMTQPEFEKAYKEALSDPALGPPNADKISLAEAMLNTDDGEEIMAGNFVKTNKAALKGQEKSKEGSYVNQQKDEELRGIDTELAEVAAHPDKFNPAYVAKLKQRRDVFLGQVSKESQPGYNPQNRVNQRFNELVNKSGLQGIPKDPDEIREMPAGPLKTAAIKIQLQASQEQDENAAKEAMSAKQSAPGDTSNYIDRQKLLKSGRAVGIQGEVSVHDLMTNKNYVKATPDQRKQLAELNVSIGSADQVFKSAEEALKGDSWGDATADRLLSTPDSFLNAEAKAWTKKRYPELATYVGRREATLGKFARSISGEVGVLTDQDISRVRNLFPVGGDTKTIRDSKRKALTAIVELNRKFTVEMLAGELAPEDVAALKETKPYRDAVNGIFGSVEALIPKDSSGGKSLAEPSAAEQKPRNPGKSLLEQMRKGG